jgi:hypothetical protein
MAYSPRASGLGNSAAYQVAGKPYLTGSAIEGEPASGNTWFTRKEYKITFPTVTRKVTITNYCSSSDIAVYFVPKATSPSVVTGNHFAVVRHTSGSLEMNVKCTELYITPGAVGANDAVSLFNPGLAAGANFGAVGIMAELTGVPATEMYTLSGSGISVAHTSDGVH